MKNITSLLVTGGGKITCLRCTAMSKRSGEQCKKPALKTSRTHKCQFHGGRSTGPKTEAGKVRSATASITSGEFTMAARLEDERQKALNRVLEDAVFFLNMASAPRTRGRKPALYVHINSEEEILDAIIRLSRNST
jgi:hypothetical protein